ncbi:major facilitator superfamily domain-containing protein [Dunaliella salina]|uniref:Major facilitator superfamily domain-containing protein n=1 Tax=Dunaliella salina TaxID=3046 RepID=A0ABQ7GV38_DUNSA|nr:major facilitator superfamily domain-containing protein [Dunaliella salina]|eukprot:KAF5838485.1 major facilitator superfamily domain-containing protein [Dunaliella salina]
MNPGNTLEGARAAAAAAEQKGGQAQIKPSLGYLNHPCWSDDGSGLVGGSLAGDSPETRTHPGTPTVAKQIAEQNRQLCTALRHHMSLRTPSSPKKILRMAASDSSSSSSGNAGSALSSMEGDNIWGETDAAQLEMLVQQRRELEKYQAGRLQLRSLLTTAPESQEPCVPGLSPTSPFGSYAVDVYNSSNDNSIRDTRINPFLKSHPRPPPKLISGKSLRLLLGLSVLLMVDAMGAGMIPGAIVVHYFHTKYSCSQSLLGSLLSISSTVAGFAGLLAGWLSDRMGLVKTMVITHLPSSCMLLLVPFTPPAVAMTMIVARACLGRMDVGPRQSYISGIVPAHERTAALGITNILRSLGAAVGPVVTGQMATAGLWPEVFCLSGGLMIVYNIALLIFFKAIPADHELVVIPHQQQALHQEQPQAAAPPQTIVNGDLAAKNRKDTLTQSVRSDDSTSR